MLAAQFFIEKSPPDVTVRGAGLDVGAWFCSDAKTEEECKQIATEANNWRYTA
ncbi:hypothetical protein GUITHDRAFT_155049 [Guillardia theta CCMP2712]|uniref:Uncharacterized protein n=1 Tax=Guillardia theta (strain CCMP2712) TaxID=905079 RepID=L1ILY6_GUITC|nr:hypothetical protein GUITHDRAFT_155049 [Guillardia theta CCMP2712]EKX37142.1 hypothetical protein GUITHDRAFT_155049 [Guillardia theta CCMP2712]|eukprot:XP_005824122.1 hypothetical protein GUITHDRAFT_155049 [Guillardia theta CCMP2712]